MEQESMPIHIRRHSQMVARVALFLANHLNQNGGRLNQELIESAGLLHDIAKSRCIRTGENHAKVGAEILQERGYPALAPIIEEHIFLDPAQVEGPLTESLLINYSDKRVKHDEIVSLEERFSDLIDRYAKTNEARTGLRERLNLYLSLEKRMFTHLSIEPPDLSALHWDEITSSDN
jgi:putative nucleotidyltransferase with HDIG domain